MVVLLGAPSLHRTRAPAKTPRRPRLAAGPRSRAAAARHGMIAPVRGPAGSADEDRLLPPDALPVPAARLRVAPPLRVGRRALGPVRPRAGPRPLSRVPRRAGARRGDGLRRHLRERAPPE